MCVISNLVNRNSTWYNHRISLQQTFYANAQPQTECAFLVAAVLPSKVLLQSVCVYVQFHSVCPWYKYLEWICDFYSRWEALPLAYCYGSVLISARMKVTEDDRQQNAFSPAADFLTQTLSLDKWERDAAITLRLTFSLCMRWRSVMELSHA